MNILTIGIDITANVFQLRGVIAAPLSSYGAG